ncbi:dihydrodipicolinate synthase family protein [Alteribacillus sp. HJP-4]|uniref:dihydrodipicolinate synthase family protein n=1 Tax=Alteribacillus sp. HJP-4 TaxID=2775394 RepID=UPI0035CCD5E2
MNEIQAAKKLEGISAINITPFQEDASIDWKALDANIDFLIENGLEVIVPSGNTGEFYALTIEESIEENRRTAERVNGRAMMVAGVGYSVETAVEMGRTAKKDGCDAIMIHMPIHPYMTEDGVVNYFQRIMEEIDMPAVLYFKNPALSDNVLKRLTHMKQLAGVKYAVNDLPRFAKIVQETPATHGVTWVCGTAEKWAPFFWNAGAKGFTSGLVNLHPRLSFEMLEALQTSDWDSVWNIWYQVVPFEDLRAKNNNGNNVVVIKEAMEALGFPAGKTREPVAPLDEADHNAVLELLEKWGLTKEQFSAVR